MNFKIATHIFFLIQPLLFLTSAEAMVCAQARTPVEITICSDDSLQKLDTELSNVYSEALSKIPANQKRFFRQQQLGWLKKRDRCGRDATCLSDVLTQRIESLRSFSPKSVDTAVDLPNSFYTKTSSDPQAKVLARGDLNGDGYEDAIVQEMKCAASCSIIPIIVLNEKNLRAKRLPGSDYFSGYNASGAQKTELKAVTIANGIITFVGNGFESPDQSEDPLPWKTLVKAQYRLVGNKVKLINMKVQDGH